MKNNRINISLVLAVILIISSFGNLYADKKEHTEFFGELKQALAKYSNEYDFVNDFSVIDKNGNDVTGDFFKHYEKYSSNLDWGIFSNYLNDEITSITYKVTFTSNGEVGKTSIQKVSKTIHGEHNTTVKADVWIKGTIYYDRDTFVVKRVSNPILQSTSHSDISGLSVSLLNPNSVSSSSYISGNTGRFNISITFWGWVIMDAYYIIFDNEVFSMSISPY